MTADHNTIESGYPENLNSEPEQHAHSAPHFEEDIVSVNKKSGSNNKLAKGMFILLVCSVIIGLLSWFGQNWLNTRKAQMRASQSTGKVAQDTSVVFNPEKTGTAPMTKPKLGSDSGAAAPSQIAVASAVQPGAVSDTGLRVMRGADGKAMVNGKGETMGVDKDGNVVTVPAIELAGNSTDARKPLPGGDKSGSGSGQYQGGGDGTQAKPQVSRYAGSLFVGEPLKPSNAAANNNSNAPTPAPGTALSIIGQQLAQTQQIANTLRNSGLYPGAAGTSNPSTGTFAGSPPLPQPYGQGAYTPAQEQTRPGTIGGSLYSSATPVALAKRLSDQNLILPKGRQADCILTGRIIDEVPGFTSCVLAQNLYSDNGRVLLLERGSELTGEYGVSNQLGLERLFVTWSRLKTPQGIEVDLSSPGSDRLGTSGIPGNLDNRWGARIGAAFLLSFVKDVTVAIINNQTKQSGGGTSVNVQSTPGQNTVDASASLAEEVIKQTIKVRPRLTINEGERISIYVARDLDFSPVYNLKTAALSGGSLRAANK